MRRATALAWFAMAVAAGSMGVLLVISDEPGATAGRWHLGFGVLGTMLGIWGFRLPRIPAAFVVASVALSVLIAVQAYWIGEFAYLGLTNILLAMAALAKTIGVVAWVRER